MIFFNESIQNKRSRNEDSYCHMEIRINHEAKVSAFAVADGMGGLSGGKQYSDMAVSQWFEELVRVLMGEEFKNCPLKNQIETLKEFSAQIFHSINRKLFEYGMDAGIKGGTTLTTAIHFWDSWIIANCGDSPVYVWQDGKVELISEIQNVAWQMVREKKTQVGSSLFFQSKNRLLEYLGRRDPVHPCVQILEKTSPEAILMGTDGAFGDLTQQKMEQQFHRSKDPGRLLTDLLKMARDQGENDNQTAILIYPEITPVMGSSVGVPLNAELGRHSFFEEGLGQSPFSEGEPGRGHFPEEEETIAFREESDPDILPEGSFRELQEEPFGARLLKHLRSAGKRRP